MAELGGLPGQVGQTGMASGAEKGSRHEKRDKKTWTIHSILCVHLERGRDSITCWSKINKH